VPSLSSPGCFSFIKNDAGLGWESAPRAPLTHISRNGRRCSSSEFEPWMASKRFFDGARAFFFFFYFRRCPSAARDAPSSPPVLLERLPVSLGGVTASGVRRGFPWPKLGTVQSFRPSSRVGPGGLKPSCNFVPGPRAAPPFLANSRPGKNTKLTDAMVPPLDALDNLTTY